MRIPLKFDLYKESGKWKYGGECTIDSEIAPWEYYQVLSDIDENQNEVVKGTIASGEYHVVISMVDDFDYSEFKYQFYQMLFTPQQVQELNFDILRQSRLDQIDYSANLQKFVECLIRGRNVPEEVLEACPHHAKLLEDNYAKTN